MLFGIIFVLELIVLFILSQQLSKSLSFLLLRITNSQQITINILSFIFLPGIIIHELAHWFMASILFVRTGEIEFLPQIQGDVVKLGSVAIAKTDLIRRFLIGVAPIIIGLGIMLLVFSFFSSIIPQKNWQTVVLIYLFFEIGNTMFSSKKDMEGAMGLLIGVLVISFLAFIFGARIQLSMIENFFTPGVINILQKMNILLAVPVGINLVFVLIFHVLLRKHY